MHCCFIKFSFTTMKSTLLITIFCVANCFASSAQQIYKPIKKFTIKPTIIDVQNAINADCTLAVTTSIQNNDNVLSCNGDADASAAQIDPQVAVSANYVLHLTNNAAIVYNKSGVLLQAININCLTKSIWGIDPKLYYDANKNYFGFSVYDYEDVKNKKPFKFMISQSENPTSYWYQYKVSGQDAEDGGSIGYGKDWIVYEYPTKKGSAIFVFNAALARAGKALTMYKFMVDVGQPIFNQDNGDAYFIKVNQEDKRLLLHKLIVVNGVPQLKKIWDIENTSPYQNYPNYAKQMRTDVKIASGDFNPKNAVISNNTVWFCHAVDNNNKTAIEWMQLNISNGNIINSNIIENSKTNYIHPTIAVNTRGDMAIGFEEVNKNSFVSARCAYILAKDIPYNNATIINIAEGNSAFNPNSAEKNVPWGDYSCTTIDAANGIDFWSAQNIMLDDKVQVKIFRISLK